MIHIDYRDPRPIYLQIKEELRRQIFAGVLRQGEQLPSVREMATRLAINPNTIQRAYRELESEGCICSVPGKGSFVTQAADARQARQVSLLDEFDNCVEELRLSGLSVQELAQRLKRHFRQKEERQ